MDSSELHGFSDWHPWAERVPDCAPNQPGVYVFRLAGGEHLMRLEGQSDIVYVGWGSSIQRRLRRHLKARDDERDIGFRLSRVLAVPRPLEVAWTVLSGSEEAKNYEADLIARFGANHIELPPLNRQETGKKDRLIEKTIGALTGDGLLGALRSLLPPQQHNLLPKTLSPEQIEVLKATMLRLRKGGSASASKATGGA
jgi:hypothetical protein